MKKIVQSIMCLMLTIMIFGGNIVLAKSSNKSITVTYNGTKLEFDQQPVIENGRTKVPFRKIFESIGTIVYYNNNEKSIMALTKTGDIITHKIGTNKAAINGKEKTYDSSSTLINGRTVVPVRMISDLLCADVEWLEKEKLVEIEKKEDQIDATRKDIMNHVIDINYNPKDTNRYVDYKKKHPEMSTEQVIMNVNMDLDREFVLYTSNEKTDFSNLLKGSKHYDSKIEDREEISNPNDILVLVNNFNTIPNSYEPNDLVDVAPPPNWAFIDREILFRDEAAKKFNEMKQEYMSEYGYDEYALMPYAYASPEAAIGELARYRYWAKTGFEGRNRLSENGIEKFAYDYSSSEPEMSDLRTGLSFNIGVNIETLLLDYKNQNFDVNHIRDTTDIDFLMENSYKYGFIIRYPNGKKNITKKEYMPWYYRYVGVDVAQQMHDENLCLEEYYAKYLNPTVNEDKYSIDKDLTQKVLKNIL